MQPLELATHPAAANTLIYGYFLFLSLSGSHLCVAGRGFDFIANIPIFYQEVPNYWEDTLNGAVLCNEDCSFVILNYVLSHKLLA